MAGFCDVSIPAIIADVALDNNLIFAIKIAMDAHSPSFAAQAYEDFGDIGAEQVKAQPACE